MKKFINLVCLVFVMFLIFSNISCSSLVEPLKSFEVTNEYFSSPVFDKYSTYSVGVNGHPSEGYKYYIRIKTNCSVDLVEYECEIEFHSKEEIILGSDSCSKDEIGKEITLSFEVSQYIYENIDHIKASQLGVSNKKPETVMNNNVNEDIGKELILIDKITLNNRNCAIDLGQEIILDYSVSPVNFNEDLEIIVENSDIISLENNKITGLKEGVTNIIIKPITDSKGLKETKLSIKVNKPFDYNEFISYYESNMESCIVKVQKSHYSTTWWGGQKLVAYKMGYGVIVNSEDNVHTVYSHLDIFDTSYEGEWTVTDSSGYTYTFDYYTKYTGTKIIRLKFNSSRKYYNAKISETPLFENDNLVSPEGYINKYSKLIYVDSERFGHNINFLLQASEDPSFKKNTLLGIPIFNSKYEVVGLHDSTSKSYSLHIFS